MAVRPNSEALEPIDPNKFYSANFLAQRWGIHHLTINPVDAAQERSFRSTARPQKELRPWLARGRHE